MTNADSDNTYVARSDDLAVIGYPKSGNNLILFRIVRLRYGHRMNWAGKSNWVQIIGKPETIGDLSPRLLWSHEAFEHGYPKVIYIVRDPRDVVVSYYHHNKKFYGPSGWKVSFSTFFDQFIAGKLWPGAWEAHVEGWLAQKDAFPDDVHVARYEDLVCDPSTSTQELSRFLDCGATGEDVEDAVNWSEFSNMRRLEDEQSQAIDAAIKGDSMPESRLHFVRRGKISGWSEELSEDQQARAVAVWGGTMSRLGYA